MANKNPKPTSKKKYVDSPENLLKLWDEYKAHIDQNPDVQEVATSRDVQTIRIKKPYLRQGFESYVFRKYGFHIHQYIDNWKGAYDSYLGIVTHVKNEWQTDQIEGTLTGRYKAPNLVARINGLTESQKTEQSGTLTIVYKDLDANKSK